MNDINELLFVVESYNGISEHNILYTKEEFLTFLTNNGLSDFNDDIEFLLDNKNSCFEWKSLNTRGGTFEFRRCIDENDLSEFISGKYNDSIEKMEARGLEAFGKYKDFKWNNLTSSFSPKSFSLLSQLQVHYPLVKEVRERLFNEKSSLDDIIRHCQQHGSAQKRDISRQFAPSLREL